ncbi:STM4015 family protein [Paenibacillus sp. WQ 127069]|uniref:STM4015 family protein n=1 Tax=Paenibacillus baimaensis TaxID=2982185 RepID=A0ABT2ULF9_9BACL|nr:STM4015 family protein [Paenibacillus sp. WQ 127069]MCU6795495.1 STM4015 family protein [Paenibacillus sp. WQ 127069]
MTEVRLVLDYDDHEQGQTMEKLIEELAVKPESRELHSLIIGSWGDAYENDSSALAQAIIQAREQFPNLTKLFIGDMEGEECEISWIKQSDLTPLLDAYPKLQSFTVQGSEGLRLTQLKHAHLEELIIICGGLPLEVIQDIQTAELPELKKLELYLGVDNYGWNGSLDDLKPFMSKALFPKLTYLGLKNSEIQDEIAIAIADAPILDQLHTLDLSQGTLSDIGAEALLVSSRIQKLSFLNLSYHYMSEAMIKRWKESGIQVDVSDEQGGADEDDWRYPAVTE